MLSARTHPLAYVALLVLVAMAAIGIAGAPAADASNKRQACQEWGKTVPTQLSVNQARKSVLCLLNKKRRAHGLPALRRDARLEAAAQRHTERMDGTGCFAHECPGEAGLTGRLQGIGYLVNSLLRYAFGENVGWGEGGKGTPKSIVAAWMNSSGHRANILNRSYREIGVGFAQGTPSSGDGNGGIYTTDFGLRVD